MKVPDIFVPEKDLEKKVEQLLNGQTSKKVEPGGIVFSYDDIFEEDGTFKEMAQVILDHVIDQNDREKYLKELKTAKAIYKEKMKIYLQTPYKDMGFKNEIS